MGDGVEDNKLGEEDKEKFGGGSRGEKTGEEDKEKHLGGGGVGLGRTKEKHVWGRGCQRKELKELDKREAFFALGGGGVVEGRGWEIEITKRNTVGGRLGQKKEADHGKLFCFGRGFERRREKKTSSPKKPPKNHRTVGRSRTRPRLNT